MWNFIKIIKSSEAAVTLVPIILSGLASPIVQKELDQRIAEERTQASLVQEQQPCSCDINDKPQTTQGQEISEKAKEIDLGDWAEEKKRQSVMNGELEASSRARQEKAEDHPHLHPHY